MERDEIDKITKELDSLLTESTLAKEEIKIDRKSVV